ncbi:ATP-grasp domain-containing protein [Nonomuraea sp. NPDC059023]
MEVISRVGLFCDVVGRPYDEVAGLLAAYAPDGIVTYSEFQLEWTAHVAAGLGLPFHDPRVVRDLTRKHDQRMILNAAGVSSTRTFLVNDMGSARAAAAGVTFPCVLKPNVGAGARDTYLIEDAGELLDVAAGLLARPARGDAEAYVVEERMTGCSVGWPWGDYVSVESIVSSGAVTHLGITGKFALAPPYRERGGYLPARLDGWDPAAIEDVAGRAIAALGVRTGICHTELKMSPDGPAVIEMNGRLGGNIYDLFLRGRGLNLVAVGARIALGEDVDVPAPPSGGVVFHYYGTSPMRVSQVTRVDGVAEARALPGVTRLTMQAEPGAVADWRHGVRGKMYACCGQVDTHEELARLIDQVERTVDIGYAPEPVSAVPG